MQSNGTSCVCAGWAFCGHGAPGEQAEDEIGDTNVAPAASVDQAAAVVGAAEATAGGMNSDAGALEAACAPASGQIVAPEQGANGLARSDRQEVGLLCKRLIDHGRVEWLRRHGLDATLVCYCEARHSGENRLILARPVR